MSYEEKITEKSQTLGKEGRRLKFEILHQRMKVVNILGM